MKIEVVPYNPLWVNKFESEKNLLERILGDVIVAIHHIGSTAVKGLSAKPIIDIIAEAKSLGALDKLKDNFEHLGYDAMGEFGIVGRRYYRKGGDNRTHQIHAFKVGDPNIHRHLVFRNYLAAHPNVRKEYQTLKLGLASTCNNDIDQYCDGKDEFVKYHEAKALEWEKLK